ncbi:MAG: NfeD family protein [Pseudomonadota bacterium]
MFESIAPWHWLTLGLLLLGLELLGAGGFLLGIATSAAVIALCSWLFDGFAWQGQLTLFAVLSVLYSWIWFQFLRKRNSPDEEFSLINNRAAQLIGTVIEVTEDIPAGTGKVAIGDTLWTVRTATNVTSGDRVRVTASQGMELQIEPAP